MRYQPIKIDRRTVKELPFDGTRGFEGEGPNKKRKELRVPQASAAMPTTVFVITRLMLIHFFEQYDCRAINGIDNILVVYDHPTLETALKAKYGMGPAELAAEQEAKS